MLFVAKPLINAVGQQVKRSRTEPNLTEPNRTEPIDIPLDQLMDVLTNLVYKKFRQFKTHTSCFRRRAAVTAENSKLVEETRRVLVVFRNNSRESI